MHIQLQQDVYTRINFFTRLIIISTAVCVSNHVYFKYIFPLDLLNGEILNISNIEDSALFNTLFNICRSAIFFQIHIFLFNFSFKIIARF